MGITNAAQIRINQAEPSQNHLPEHRPLTSVIQLMYVPKQPIVVAAERVWTTETIPAVQQQNQAILKSTCVHTKTCVALTGIVEVMADGVNATVIMAVAPEDTVAIKTLYL